MTNVTYINAGAGSGKTYRLTETLTKLIKTGKVKPEELILTTFTTKAANEFKEKAKAFLFEEGLYEAAIQLDHAMIGTVHSVCQRMVGKYWFNLGLSPKMNVLAEEDTTYYMSQSLAELPTEEELNFLNDYAEYFELRKYADNRQKGIDYDFWQEHLKNIIKYATNYELDDFAKSEQKSLDYIRQFVKPGCDCTFTYAELKALVDEHESFLRSCRQSKTNDERIQKLQQARFNLNNPTIATYNNIDTTIGTPKGYGPLAADFKDKFPKLWTSQQIYQKQEKYIKLLFDLAKRWKENFAQFKREKNLLDYNDMEKYMRLLLQDKDIITEISQSYRYLFVDEYQDSSPIQVKIFDTLSDHMEHSYWVGDYKQAIYGFRGSDIAMIKAIVDRVSSKENGCDTDTLDKSWRSLPDIVDVNNNIFEKTFANVLAKKNIHLDKVRENTNEEESLRYFVGSEDKSVAGQILRLLKQGAKPNEIAVLALTNDKLTKLTEELKALNIPSSCENSPVIESRVYQLVESLLRIVGSDKDTLSKAQIAKLTDQANTTRKIIEDKILLDADETSKTEDYLSEIPLISQLKTIRPRLQKLSVATLVESMIIELNLYDEIKKLEQDPTLATSYLQTIINTARVYEDHSVKMNLPATIDGFLAYINEENPNGSGDPQGVQLLTYHASKGLQWKYVILMSLDTNVADLKKSIKNETYGVHAIHEVDPSAENPYPEVYIRLTPWVYGANKNIPDEVSTKIEATESFKQAYKSMLAEKNRLLYVGMTRSKDVLILNIKKPQKGKSPLQWPKDIGLNTVTEVIPESEYCDIFGTGNKFKNITLTDTDTLAPYSEHDHTQTMPLNIKTPTYTKLPPRYLSPSSIHTKGQIQTHHDFETRIPFAHQPSDISIVGDCIHHIFAVIEDLHATDPTYIKRIIASYGMTKILTDTEAIRQAWQNLVRYLNATHGAARATHHERPFRHERDGQIITGSIDLVWQTDQGSIIVDYKTCPMGPKAILDTQSEHYAAWYSGQLDAYQYALQAAGEKVLKRYLYYPVSGLLVAI